MENKQKICDLLLAALQATYSASDLVSLTFDAEEKSGADARRTGTRGPGKRHELRQIQSVAGKSIQERS